MHRALPSLMAFTALVSVSPVAVAAEPATECLEELAKVESANLTVYEHFSAYENRGLASLRSAVQFLARQGRDDACESLVETVQEIFSDRRQQLVEEGLLVDVDQQARVDRLEEAPGIDQVQRPLRAADLIGRDLRNTRDEYLGEIEDVVFDSDGRISHVLAETGGFLGLGEHVVAVPLAALRVPSDLNAFVLDMSKERFEQAPSLDPDQVERINDAGWQMQNNRYYEMSADN